MTQRNSAIDSMRLIAAFGVVVLHSQLFLKEQVFKLVFAFAVPFFLMVSGYYLFRPAVVNNKKFIKKLTKSLSLFLLFEAGYLIFYSIKSLIDGSLNSFISSVFDKVNSVSGWFETLVLNRPVFADHAWYLSALVVILALLFIFKRFVNLGNKALFVISAVLIMTSYLLCNIYGMLDHDGFDYLYTRNWLFSALPYFLIGGLFNRITIKFSDKVLAGIAVFSLIEPIVFRLILLKLIDYIPSINDLPPYGISSLGTVAFVCSVFALLVKHPNWGENSRIAKWGLRYSLGIYFVHIMFIEVIDAIVLGIKTSALFSAYRSFSPFLIFGLSLLTVMLYYKLKDAVTSRKKVMQVK